jgi:type 1 glutamine amidotransferase
VDSSASTDAAAAAKPLKVLYLTGGGFHDYNHIKDTLIGALTKLTSASFVVKFVGDVNDFANPNLTAGYDAAILNVCYADGDYDRYARNLSGLVDAGLKAVVLHCTMHTFRGTDTWAKAIGMRTVMHEPYGTMSVDKAGAHAITATWPTAFTTTDERYVTQTLYPGSTALLRSGGHTLGWLHPFGKGLVFGTTLGHDNPTNDRAEYQRLIAAGLLYVTGHLGADGLPEAGYGGKQPWK